MKLLPFTQDQLREELDYDPATGLFTRLIARSNCVKIGDIAGSLDSHGHIQIRVWGRLYLAHRLAWFWVKDEWAPLVDHRNTKRADNRWKNLRKATRDQNGANSVCSKHSATQAKNIVPQGGKFRLRMTMDGKRAHIGYYDSIAEAQTVYAIKASEAHGEFARIG